MDQASFTSGLYPSQMGLDHLDIVVENLGIFGMKLGPKVTRTMLIKLWGYRE